MKTTIKTLLGFAFLSVLTVSQATPVTGTIDSAGNYSVIHDGAVPAGTGDPGHWLWFAPGQQIDLHLDGGLLTLDGPQAFQMIVPAVETADVSLILLDMRLDLNDADGFAGGFIVYTLDGIEPGVFFFPDQVFGDSSFNTSSQHGNMLDVFVWGADPQHGLGMDLALSVVLPEPTGIALILIGLSGMALAYRRRRAAHARAHVNGR